MVSLRVNGKTVRTDADPDTPLVWVLRERLGLVGTKFGCGAGLCGSCTVHIDGKARRSCQVKAGSVEGREITTIEGLPADHPLKRAWLAEEVVQCGYCQPGQIMQAAALLAEDPAPSDEKIVRVMGSNLCRCGTYLRILAAVRSAAKGAGGR